MKNVIQGVKDLGYTRHDVDTTAIAMYAIILLPFYPKKRNIKYIVTQRER